MLRVEKTDGNTVLDDWLVDAALGLTGYEKQNHRQRETTMLFITFVLGGNPKVDDMLKESNVRPRS